MNTLLAILGILGLGAIVIAAYVFTSAARKYVVDSNRRSSSAKSPSRSGYVVRSGQDRRQFTGVIEFPLKLPNGQIIDHDRRMMRDRRLAAA